MAMMLDNLLFSIDRVLPFFLLIIIGWWARRREVLPASFFKGANRFVFTMAIPASLFLNLCAVDWPAGSYGELMLFLFVGSVATFFVAWGVGEALYKDKKSYISAFAQGAFRGNYSVLGVPLVAAVVDNKLAVPAALGVAVIIPTYSVFSTILLVLCGEKGKEGAGVGQVLHSIATNPLIVSSVGGLLWGLLGLPVPSILRQTAGYLGSCATGLGLLSIGGIFQWKLARERMAPTVVATVLKLLMFPAFTIAAAYLIGFRDLELFLIFITFANPTSVSSYPMAVELGGDGPLAANILILTTLLSSLVFAAGIYLMRTVGWI